MGLVLNSKQQIDNLIYTYEDNQTSNKVRAISDQSGSTANLGDFTDNNTTADDYGYDLNGNLITDLNKRIAGNIGVDQTSGGGIIYSYKNLPWQVSAKNPDGSANGTITFIYDANGRRLEKRTNILASSYNNNTASNTINSYLGPFIYTNNALQYFLQEDGKVRPTTNTSQPYVYDYFLKDHLQDTRMVLTDEQQQVWYPAATVEMTPSTSLPVEEANYEINTADITLMSGITGYNGNYPNNNGNPPYNTNPNSNTSAQSLYMYKLNGATGDKTGLGITIKVMTGDQVNIWGKAFYNINGTINNTYTIVSALNAFITSFAGTPAIAAGAHGATAAGLESSPVTPGMLQSWLGTIPVPPSTPKAYINWILFDEQFRPITTGTNSGFLSVGTNADQIVSLAGTATITTSGYLYVYCSNESNNDVYFDNLQVEQTRGPLLEENHYYPFGLSMAGLNSKVIKTGYTENKRKFVGKELDDDLALDWYQFEFRDHDPQIGRFHQIDPSADKYQGNSTYAYSENRPVNGKDQEGREYDWYNMYMMYKDLTSGGFGYGSIFSSLQNDMQADFRAQNQNFGNFNGTQPISQQVQDNQTQAAIAQLNVTGDMGNLMTKEMNDGLTLLTLPSPEFSSMHMLIEGAETKNYTEVGLSLLTFGVSGAFGYLATDLEAASVATDPAIKTAEFRDFATGVENVLRNSDVAVDQVSAYGADYGNKFIIVGRDMDGRIIPAVKALQDAGLEVDYWNGWSYARTDAQNLAENTAWIKEKLAQGYNVIDIGLSPEFTIQGNFDFGAYYQMESYNISQSPWLYRIQTPN
jgi:RHS repeat-associated protein